jgi:hypothetical protein
MNNLSSGVQYKVRVKLSLYQVAEASESVRCRGSHIAYKIGSEMAVRLSASCAGQALIPGRSSGTHFSYRLRKPLEYGTAGRIR